MTIQNLFLSFFIRNITFLAQIINKIYLIIFFNNDMILFMAKVIKKDNFFIIAKFNDS